MTSPQEHFKKGKDLKAQGQFDAALTEFRRAIIGDPEYVEALIEVGQLCWDKSKSDPMFLRYAFEAYQKAARLNPTNQDSHDKYIMVGQKLSRLEELHDEYAALCKKHPDNELFARCKKNILTISMAMMPQHVDVGNSSMGKTLRKVVLFASLGSLFFSLVLMMAPVVLKNKFSPEVAKKMIRVGAFMGIAGVGGFIGRAFIR